MKRRLVRLRLLVRRSSAKVNRLLYKPAVSCLRLVCWQLSTYAGAGVSYFDKGYCYLYRMQLSEKEYEDCKEQFRTRLMILVEEFYSIQINKFSKATAQKYFIVAYAWIDYLYGYTNCLSYSDITMAQTNSNFFACKRYEELYEFDSKEVKNKLKSFVEFLREKGNTNPKVDKAVLKK